jgi:hypothetical protein
VNNKRRANVEFRRAAVRSATGLVAVFGALVGFATATNAMTDQAATTADSAKPAAAMTAKPHAFVKESLHHLTATVTAISMDTREVTLKGADGKEQTIKVGPDARNLGQVKVGDQVRLSYYEGFTAQMRLHDKPNEGFQNAAGATVAPDGGRPGGAAAQSTAGTVTIDSVDAAGKKVTFHRPDGVVVTIPIKSDEGLKFVKTLKKGDVVDVMYTEALAIDVVPAKAKSN